MLFDACVDFYAYRGQVVFYISVVGPYLAFTDSIMKYITAKYTKVQFFKGFCILQIADIIRFGKIDISGFFAILFHVGINDIANLLKQDKLKYHTVHDIMYRYHAINAAVRRRNSHAILIFSAILPQAASFDLYFPLVYGLNFALEKWCAQSSGRRVFIPTHKMFLRGGRPREELYAASDMVHPNGAGCDVLESFVQQALSPSTIRERVCSKRVAKLAALSY